MTNTTQVKQQNKLVDEKMNNEAQLNYLKFQALDTAINPHFIFNSLNSIQTLINANENDAASDYLVKFSRFIRLVMDKAKEGFVTIAHEEKLLTFYLQLEKMRFNDKVNFAVHMDSSIYKENTFIPNMVIQPLIENAITHGLLPQDGGTIEINFKNTQDAIVITIDDDGVGFKTSKNKDTNFSHKPMGLINIANRLNSISEATLSVVDKKNQKGTLATLYIPKITFAASSHPREG